MDDRLRQFSPPPWAALGRRDPNHEQAPWRESENLEWRVNPSWKEWGRALVQDDLPHLPERIIGNLSAMGQRPASDELMQKYMDDASELLPRSNVDIEAPYRIPYYAAARADGGSVPTLTQGPAPTGRDKVFDSIYGWLGGKPENRWAADKLTDVATLGGMAPWTAAYDGGRELAETGRPEALAMALLPGARVVVPVAKIAQKAAEKGIRAFHGSPHDFDRFDISKIGTGEGAQAYGHGLYFAENEGVARSYRDALAADQMTISGEKFVPGNYAINGIVARHRGDPTALETALRQYARVEVDNPYSDVNDALKIADAIRDGKFAADTPGRMYEVNIKANPDEFLDWDKPLTQQSERVRQIPAIQALIKEDADYLARYPHQSERTGANVLSSIGRSKETMTNEAALREAGIPGIRYLDQGSRTAGEGSRNYVVFDDKIIDIIRKYGIAGLLAAYYGTDASPADAKPQQD